jgi:hypothetical protein
MFVDSWPLRLCPIRVIVYTSQLSWACSIEVQIGPRLAPFFRASGLENLKRCKFAATGRTKGVVVMVE